MSDIWNAKVSAKRFIELSQEIIDNSEIQFYGEGPLSIANKNL